MRLATQRTFLGSRLDSLVMVLVMVRFECWFELLMSGGRSRIRQHLQDALCEMLIDFGVSRYGLRHFRDRIMIPIVLATVANKDTTTCFKLPNKVFALHRRVSSANLRTPGISPLVRSRKRSRRLASRSSRDSPCVQ